MKSLKLHLGCGKKNFGKDWIHIDGSNYPHLDSHDIVNLPYKSNSVDIIYASHVLEYFDRDEGLDILKKWYKILKRRGVLRIAVPNFTALSSIVMLYDGPLEDILGPLYGKMKMGDKYIYHKTVYNCRELFDILERAGFKHFYEYDWKQTPPHDKIDDCSRAYYPHCPECIKTGKFKDNQLHMSLNVEAVK
jgi:predicted SAM-dependent methyltransferase